MKSMGWKVVVVFPDGTKRTHICASKGQAKRIEVQAMWVVDKLGGCIIVHAPEKLKEAA